MAAAVSPLGGGPRPQCAEITEVATAIRTSSSIPLETSPALVSARQPQPTRPDSLRPTAHQHPPRRRCGGMLFGARVEPPRGEMGCWRASTRWRRDMRPQVCRCPPRWFPPTQAAQHSPRQRRVADRYYPRTTAFRAVAVPVGLGTNPSRVLGFACGRRLRRSRSGSTYDVAAGGCCDYGHPGGAAACFGSIRSSTPTVATTAPEQATTTSTSLVGPR